MRHTSPASDRGPRGKTKHPGERFGDEARFIRAWLDNPLTTGAVSPSGKVLSRTMAMAVDPSLQGPVVELGPGTGPVTEALIRRGVAPERLILVEFDPDFCKLLQRRYPRACVIEGDAYDLRGSLAPVLQHPAAAVVSSLPLLTKPERQRLALLRDAFTLLDPAGVFVQFTYGLSSPVPRLDELFQPTGFRASVSAPVWLNLPPARVWTYRPDEAAADDERAIGDRRLRFKAGASKLSEDWREKRRRLRLEFLLRAEKAKLELKLRTDKLKLGLERHQSLLEDGPGGKLPVDLFEQPKSGKKAPW
ncbi:methyltransferase domain-containing protein [Lichenihabitans sp. Uapishka_5]|uniref:class I SAM-dependent methyltransferase n=1 Tax=Lichenihabitans sp. Uapishka_5 TaxID=3037302 RepID=UPI0029E812B2|nr:rRNA adenine N-6-methyltransferase family protein [Lichenihabitans sp. Uapishka_5]MDX7952323.1 methyltransferase domain-containing protein [Lichenihabitans sp. Uapishka_5]